MEHKVACSNSLFNCQKDPFITYFIKELGFVEFLRHLASRIDQNELNIQEGKIAKNQLNILKVKSAKKKKLLHN